MRWAWASFPLSLAVAVLGCSEIAGLGDFVDVSGRGGSGALPTGGASSGGGGASAGGGGASTGGGGEGGACEPAPGGAWYVLMEGSGDQESSAAAIDPCTGDVVVVGRTSDSFEVAGTDVLRTADGTIDMFVVRFDTAGQVLGSHVYGDGPGNLLPVAAAIGPDGSVVVLGRMTAPVSIGGNGLMHSGSDDIFLAKLAPDGAHVWSHSFGSVQSERPQAIAVDPTTGDIYIGGSVEAPVDFGTGKVWEPMSFDDGFVTKFDPDGNAQWVAQYGGTGSAFVDDLAIHESQLFVAGHFLADIKLEPSGSPMPSHGPQDQDVFIQELDTMLGTALPNRFETYGSTSNETYARLTSNAEALLLAFDYNDDIDGCGGVLPALCPACAGLHDVALLALDESFGCQWQERLGSMENETVLDVSGHGATRFRVTGTFDGTLDAVMPPITSSGEPDVFVASYDASGTATSTIHLPFERSNTASLALESGPNGEVVLVGGHDALTPPGGTPVVANGLDGFAVRFGPSE